MAIVRINTLTVEGESISIRDNLVAIDGEVLSESLNTRVLSDSSPIRIEVLTGVLANLYADTEITLVGPVNGTLTLLANEGRADVE